MDSETIAREAFDAARSGKRVGVLAGPRAEIAGHLQKCYSGLTMDERRGIQLYRSFNAITVDWPEAGLLKIMGRPDSFRGLTFDLIYLPEEVGHDVRRVLAPAVMVAGGSLKEY